MRPAVLFSAIQLSNSRALNRHKKQLTLQKISDTIIHTWIGSDPVILYYPAVSATISHKTAGIAASIFLSIIGPWPGKKEYESKGL